MWAEQSGHQEPAGAKGFGAIGRTLVAQLARAQHGAGLRGRAHSPCSLGHSSSPCVLQPHCSHKGHKSQSSSLTQSSSPTVFPFIITFGLSVFVLFLNQIVWICFTKVHFIHNRIHLFRFLILAVVCTRVDPIALALFHLVLLASLLL